MGNKRERVSIFVSNTVIINWIIETCKSIAVKTRQSSLSSTNMQASSGSQIRKRWRSVLEMAGWKGIRFPHGVVWELWVDSAGWLSVHTKSLPVLVRLTHWIASECNAFFVYIHFRCGFCVFRRRNVWRWRCSCILGFGRGIFTGTA